MYTTLDVESMMKALSSDALKIENFVGFGSIDPALAIGHCTTTGRNKMRNVVRDLLASTAGSSPRGSDIL